MASSGMLGRVALVRTDVSEELGASTIRVTRIGELGTTLATTSNRRTLRTQHTIATGPRQRCHSRIQVPQKWRYYLIVSFEKVTDY
jgi:hypothetical protein